MDISTPTLVKERLLLMLVTLLLEVVWLGELLLVRMSMLLLVRMLVLLVSLLMLVFCVLLVSVLVLVLLVLVFVLTKDVSEIEDLNPSMRLFMRPSYSGSESWNILSSDTA